MKLLISLLVTMFATAAFACPSLEGNYICADSEGDFEINVSQYIDGGVTIYDVNGEQIITDGVKRSSTTDDGGNVIEASVCTQNGLNQQINIDYPREGFTVDINANISPTVTGMTIVADIFFKQGEQTSTDKQITNCQKVN